MPATGDRITKPKGGLFQGCTPPRPRTARKYIYGRKYKDVERKLAEVIGDAARGIVVDDKNLTVSEYLDRFLEDVQRGSVRESTYSRDKYLITNHVKPTLGRLTLTNLNALHLQGFYRDRLDSGLSGSTVQKMHHVLHKALAQAVKWNLIPRSPADSVKAPSSTPKEMHPLSAAEARKLLATAQGDRLEALYVLAIHTGMRQGELLGLKWEDIDLDRQTVRIRWTLTRKGSDTGGSYGLGAPKTKKSRRTVRLTERAVDALRSHRARQAKEKLRVGALPTRTLALPRPAPSGSGRRSPERGRGRRRLDHRPPSSGRT
jgi:integrase